MLNGAKWKKAQVSEQSTGRLAGHNKLRKRPEHSCYAYRNIQYGSSAGSHSE